MRIIENFSYEILRKDHLREELMVIEKMGRISHWSETGPITMETAEKFTRARLHQDHHMSVIEHGIMSVIFNGISIGMSRESNRHRMTSVVERSTRYIDYEKGSKDSERFSMNFVNAPDIDANKQVDLGDGVSMSPQQFLDLTEKMYRGLRGEGIKPESARQYLPIGLETQLGVTANFREWRHIFGLRTAKPAHWEIRRVMGSLMEEVKTIVPVVLDDFQVRGQCVRGVNYYGYEVKDE